MLVLQGGDGETDRVSEGFVNLGRLVDDGAGFDGD
jgi:hypothetical protein